MSGDLGRRDSSVRSRRDFLGDRKLIGGGGGVQIQRVAGLIPAASSLAGQPNVVGDP